MTKQENPILSLRLVMSSVFTGLKFSLSFLFIVIILLVVTFLLGWDWSSHEQIIYKYSIYTAIVLGGLATGYKSKTKGWLLGMILAVVVWLLVFLVGKSWGLDLNIKAGLINGAIAVILGSLGGIVGINL
ncbi:MAG: TIGR04086 family membrane protein [Firmicutes bacterium]|nr:TIGR04086 family membrane protein [Bacillota bacterium]